MSHVTTHVLDTARGRPAAGVDVVLERRSPSGTFEQLARARTDDDGRVSDLGPDALEAGVYRLRFDTAGYQDSCEDALPTGFFPEVTITFHLHEIGQHYHVPLLLSPFGYSTYRGS